MVRARPTGRDRRDARPARYARLQELVERQRQGAACDPDHAVVGLFAQAHLERVEADVQGVAQIALPAGRVQCTALADESMHLVVSRLDDPGEVLGRGVELRRVREIGGEVVVGDPHRAAREVTGQPADELFLEHRRGVPCPPDRLVGDRTLDDPGRLHEQLAHTGTHHVSSNSRTGIGSRHL
jgi:hypothetical protein